MSLTQADLDQFNGSEQLWHQPLMSFKYTDGVKYVASAGNAYWLLTDISAFQNHAAIIAHAKQHRFQKWTLQVKVDQSAMLTCEDGNGNVLFLHEYAYTDFALAEIKFYLAHGVLLLPLEY